MKDLFSIVSILKPTEQNIEKFRLSQLEKLPNFDKQKRLQRLEFQTLEVKIGRGYQDFLASRDLIKTWRVFETPDATPYPPASPPESGQVTVNLLREFGLWFTLACKVTKVTDEKDSFGFTFETLPGHAECGW